MVCAVSALILLGASLYETVRPVRIEVFSVEASPGKTVNRVPDSIGPSVEKQSLQAFLTRPPFSPDRRPESAASAKKTSTPAGALSRNFQLTGVVLDGSRRFALIRSGTGEVERVAIGEMIEGWQVKAITASSVDLVAESKKALHLDLFPPSQGTVREGETVTEVLRDRKLPVGIGLVPAAKDRQERGLSGGK